MLQLIDTRSRGTAMATTLRRVLLVALVVILASPTVPDAAVGTVITVLDNEVVTGVVNLPPVDVRRFSRVVLLGKGEGQISDALSVAPVAGGVAASTVLVGSNICAFSPGVHCSNGAKGNVQTEGSSSWGANPCCN